MLKDFTSLDPAQEQQFLVYEQRMQNDSKKANKIGMIVAGAFGLLALIIYFTGEADMSEWEEQDEAAESESLGAEEEAAKADDQPAAVEEPEEEEAEEAEEAAADEAEAEAPEPPKGATKASPADLVK